MMPVNIEYVGGPRDGQHDTWTDEALDFHGHIPDVVEARDTGWLGRLVGLYVVTRKLTRAGRLIYEFRGGDAEAGR